MDRLSERLLGKYELLEQLGTTGLASVYRARVTSSDNVVVLKVFHNYFFAENDLGQPYLQELATVQGLRHPNIVPIYGVEQNSELFAVVMDYVPWPSLKNRTSAVLPLEEVVKIIHQVGAALDYAHNQGLVHRDLRPSNVFYEPVSGRAMVSDFATASLVEQGHILLRNTVNTPAPSYSPPEQIQGLPPNPSNDIYAIGVLAYELLTGNVPFDSLNPYTLLSRQLRAAATPPSQIEETLPSAVDDVILRALKHLPEERYSSCGEMAKALEHGAKTNSIKVSTAAALSASQEAQAQADALQAMKTKELESSRIFCPHCGTGNPATGLRCLACWASLAEHPILTPEDEQRKVSRYAARLRRRKLFIRSTLIGVVVAFIAFWAYSVIDLRPPLRAPSTIISSQSSVGEWSMHQRDVLHTGSIPGKAWIPDGTIKWKFTSNGPMLATPATADDRVFVATTDDRAVVALDKTTGDVLWTNTVNVPVSTPLVVADDLVFVGLRNWTLLALDANTGEVRWEYTTGNPIYGSATVLDGSIYLGSSDRHLYALDARTGEQRWVKATIAPIASSPAISQGIVIIGTQDQDLYMVDASNGTLRYVVSIGSPIDNSVTIVDNLAYFTTRSGNIIAFDYRQKDLSFRKALHSIWLQLYIWQMAPPPPLTPGLAWGKRLGGNVIGELATADGRLFIPLFRGEVHALSAETGEDLWKVKNLSRLRAFPIVSGDTLIQAAIDGTIYGLDVASGEQLWTISVQEEITASPILAGDTLYVPTVSGTLYAFK